jgi:endonuclease/exonuclease/phosphatase family metal-dependent hydrolase
MPRVMTYNILMGGRRGAPLHEAVRRAEADVVLVNEAPKYPLLWRGRCPRLARRWGMRFVAGGRPAGSNMIVVARGASVTSTREEVLPTGWFEPRRGIALARLLLDGASLTVVTCHLSLHRPTRLREVARIVELCSTVRGPVVLAGDLNEEPGGPCWRRLAEAGFVDHGGSHWMTFPAQQPKARIDALLVRGEATVRHHGDPGVPEALLARASDHRPVLADLGLP